jgi:hypothetical protein
MWLRIWSFGATRRLTQRQGALIYRPGGRYFALGSVLNALLKSRTA